MKTLVEWIKEKLAKPTPPEPIDLNPPPPQVVEMLEEPPPPSPYVFVHLRLYGPLQGLYQREPALPWIKIDGVTLAEAAERLPGRSLDWNTLPKEWIERLEMTPRNITLPWEQVKAFVQEK